MVDDKKEVEVDNANDMIKDAYAAADKLERENKKSEEILKRLEAIESRRILGGQSQAGEPAPVPKEETPAEYAKRMLRGGQ